MRWMNIRKNIQRIDWYMYKFKNGEEATRQTMINIVETLFKECADHTDEQKSNLASMCYDDLIGFIHYVYDCGYDEKDKGAFRNQNIVKKQ